MVGEFVADALQLNNLYLTPQLQISACQARDMALSVVGGNKTYGR